MINLLNLFWTFFKIGLFSFGGGYGMIPLINSEIIGQGLLTETELLNFIGIAESTPGPFAVNIATFVGSSQAGILGSVLTTLGVVLPSFIIILIIAAVLKQFSKNKYVQAFLSGVQPVVVGLIVATGLMVAVKCVYVNFGNFNTMPKFDYVSLTIIIAVFIFTLIWKKIFKKNIPAILLIIISAITGILFL